MIKQIAPLIVIFACTAIGWMILGGTLSSRTDASNQQLTGHLASTWGTPQEQSPPTATWTQNDGKGLVVDHSLPLESSRVQVGLHLDPRQKGLLWYSTYVVDFDGVYTFRNDTSQAQIVTARFRFPAQKAVYDGLTIGFAEHPGPTMMDDQGSYTQID